MQRTILPAARLCERSYKASTPYLTEEIQDRLFIAFQGSLSLDDWILNLQFRQIDGIHSGFLKSALRMQARLAHLIQGYDKIVWCGHSQGGAEAAIFASWYPQKSDALITFGAPRCFSRLKVLEVERSFPKGFKGLRFEYEGDVIPGVIPRWLGYAHIYDAILLRDCRDEPFDAGHDHSLSGYIEGLRRYESFFDTWVF